VVPRIRAMLGEVPFELEWVSVYQFACRRADRFRHGRVILAGDAAHQVSPFGARGANTGVQDIDNLVWKLKLVQEGRAPLALLDTYHEERAFAADDNLRQSTRSTDFITPKSAASRRLRDAVLALARQHEFARPLVNSGRLSTPTPYLNSSLNTPDEDRFDSTLRPGSPCADAPLRVNGRAAWLLEQLGEGFVLLAFGERAIDVPTVAGVTPRLLRVGRDIADTEGLLRRRYDGQDGTAYLIRPDQHVAARWRFPAAGQVEQALRTALGLASKEMTS
jgi:3-(3-hydroxy-phenyl)propionate hydroxylase